jgi:DNA-binding NarL/FixJ family response regulator
VGQIRIALIDMPRLLSEIVERVLADVKEAKIVAKLNESANLTVALNDARADLAITCASAVDEPDLIKLVRARPQMKTLAAVGDGEHAVLYDLAPRRTPLGELSATTLLAAIRLAADEPSCVPAPEPLS